MTALSSLKLGAPERIAASSRRPATLGAAAPGTISLAMGEPDAGTPTAVVDAAVRSLVKGRTRYSPMTGAPELREVLARKISAGHPRPTTTREVVLTHGGSAGLAAAMLALVQPGDRVLIPEPTYSLYSDHAAMVGAEVVWIAARTDGSLDLDALRHEAATARMIILCNPGNPTGRIYSAADLAGVGAVLGDHPDLLLLSDEAYGSIVFDQLPFASALDLSDVSSQVVYCSTLSKTYAMTGWRLGYVVAFGPLADKINLIHRTINGPLNTFVQDAALTALETPEEDLRVLTASYQDRRDLVLEALGGVAGVEILAPQGAFYAFPRISTSLTSDEMVARFAAAGVLVRSGSEFGPSGEGHVRLSFATDIATLKEGLDRFVATIADFPR
ncbi:pyridoxal phosphate-dependent aminotransferase [Paenarthrobacter nitroguajacolicus]|uniref:pyridoxal phosphate-dependent aminotransferase n=1 Tax=Paenarthrobacter nitroguajacolicus TaxID=211146 RepID=UPI0015BBE48D|nr:pyridoxal phosphate-dependent aminotransferase [Paenarthrobacter nitroguajacolicus]NWL34208.1 aspartate aminotransferase [Paenarthrobacter nitroguajacolicus]